MLHTSSSNSLLGKIIPPTDQRGFNQWKSGSAASCEPIGCSCPKQTWREPAAQGLETGHMHAELCCFHTGGLSVLTLPRRIQTDQQWLQINPYSDSDDIGLSTSFPPQWLCLNLRTKCTTLLMTWRGMLTCLISTPTWHYTGSLLRIQTVGQACM